MGLVMVSALSAARSGRCLQSVDRLQSHSSGDSWKATKLDTLAGHRPVAALIDTEQPWRGDRIRR